MNERWWITCCASDRRADVTAAVRQLEPEAKIVFARDARALRDSLADDTTRRFAVAVGATGEDVSDVNLAAAVVHDDVARRVVLVGRSLSGSLRSRAARAGIDLVFDLDAETASAVTPQGGPTPTKGPIGSSDGERQSMQSTTDDQRPTSGPVRGAQEMATSTSACAGRQKVSGASRTGEGGPAMTEAVERGAVATSVPPRTRTESAPTLVVSSGRGGVGKTTVASLGALAAASWGMRVALLDLDLGCGNLFTLFGVKRPPALDHAIGLTGAFGEEPRIAAGSPEATAAMLGAGIDVAENVRLWGPCARPEMAERVAPSVEALVDELAHRFDLVLIDSSTTCTDASAQAFQACSRLLLVHDEELGAIGSLARTASLAVRLGVARTQIVRLANRGDRRSRFDLSVGRNELGLETARAFRLLEGGREVDDLLAAGKVVQLAAQDVEPVLSIEHALATIVDELGCLPECARAREALPEAQGKSKRFRIWKGRAAS